MGKFVIGNRRFIWGIIEPTAAPHTYDFREQYQNRTGVFGFADQTRSQHWGTAR